MPALKIFVLDDNGNKLTCKEAAKKIPGCTSGKVRYYISSKGAKTISDIKNICDDIQKYGRNCMMPRKTHETIYGALTLRDIWERHPHKEEVSINAISTRIFNNGATYPGLWDGIQFDIKKTNKGKRKVCKDCGRKLEIRQFSLLEGVPGGRWHICKRCRGIIKNVGKVKVSRKTVINTCLNAKPGQLVLSDGKTYYVSECFSRRGYKAKIAAFRVDPSGQVLRRTTINLDGNWSLIA